MIILQNQPLAEAIVNEYPNNSIEKTILNQLITSTDTYRYDSLEQLKFELRLRKEIIKAANDLLHSQISFKIFQKSFCNPAYWQRKPDGGFALKEGVQPSDAIRDIFHNGDQYGTECATAMMIIYYKALLEVFQPDLFNRTFPDLYLMNWNGIAGPLREVGLMQSVNDFLPGDRRYFINPDVDPMKPEWQGENVIDMGDGQYYGHGIGKYNADIFIQSLNRRRKEDADESAYLMETAGKPNFKRLFQIYNHTPVSLSTTAVAR